MARQNPTPKKKRPPWTRVFVAALARSPNVSAAARAAEIDRSHAYARRGTDPEFAAAWDDALEQSLDELVGKVYDRACKESDTLAIFLLKSHRPEVYGERQHLAVNITADVKYQQDLDTAYADGAGPTAEE